MRRKKLQNFGLRVTYHVTPELACYKILFFPPQPGGWHGRRRRRKRRDPSAFNIAQCVIPGPVHVKCRVPIERIRVIVVRKNVFLGKKVLKKRVRNTSDNRQYIYIATDVRDFSTGKITRVSKPPSFSCYMSPAILFPLFLKVRIFVTRNTNIQRLVVIHTFVHGRQSFWNRFSDFTRATAPGHVMSWFNVSTLQCR